MAHQRERDQASRVGRSDSAADLFDVDWAAPGTAHPPASVLGQFTRPGVRPPASVARWTACEHLRLSRHKRPLRIKRGVGQTGARREHCGCLRDGGRIVGRRAQEEGCQTGDSDGISNSGRQTLGLALPFYSLPDEVGIHESPTYRGRLEGRTAISEVTVSAVVMGDLGRCWSGRFQIWSGRV